VTIIDGERYPLSSRSGSASADPAAHEVDAAVTLLFDEQYTRMLRVAAALLGDFASAEDVVQDAFLAVHSAWPRIADKAEVSGYLHRCVVNGARSRLRRRAVAQRLRPVRGRDVPSAEETALGQLSDTRLLDALRGLPRCEREAVVLRYYVDLSEREAAAALGVRPGSVKGYASRGMARLRDTLDDLAEAEERA
jgi:RNA polymerase sigma-70 factor (sigma-E family)